MPDQPTPVEDDHVTDGAILELISDDDVQRPWTVDEIVREMGSRPATVDGLNRLYGAGLIHRCGEFVWPTRAALAASALTL